MTSGVQSAYGRVTRMSVENSCMYLCHSTGTVCIFCLIPTHHSALKTGLLDARQNGSCRHSNQPQVRDHSFSLNAVGMYLGFVLAIFRDAAGHGLLDTGHI
jgi:hypothetical protein